jgi:cytochrome P450
MEKYSGLLSFQIQSRSGNLLQLLAAAFAVGIVFYVLRFFYNLREFTSCDGGCSGKRVILENGPKRYPLLGSLFAFWKNRKRHIEWSAEMLAESATQTIVLERLGGIRTVLTANPENVEHILKTRFDNYPKGEPFTAILHDLLGKGIFNSDGDAWKLQRKIASYEFNTRSLRNFVLRVVVEEVTDRLLPVLHNACEKGSCLDFQDILQRFAFDTICKVSFGVDPAWLDTCLNAESELAVAFDVASNLSAERSSAPIQLVWKMKRLLNIGSEKRLSEAVGVVHEFAREVIRRRRIEISDGSSTAAESKLEQSDLISRFMALGKGHGHYVSAAAMGIEGEDYCSDEFLRDMIISFVLAGRDTTSSALTWFFWLLSSHPHVEEAIYKEVAHLIAARRSQDKDSSFSSASLFSYEELQKMHYLHASICESMRLYPPVLLDSKHALHNDVLPDGTFVGKGTRVTYHPYAMGRMEAIWGADCLQFKPERWVNDDGHFVPQSPFKFAVFQGGVRVCLGKEMAFIQMKYVSATVISMFRLHPPVDSCERTPKLVHSLTARMDGGFPVVVQRRTTPFPTAIPLAS